MVYANPEQLRSAQPAIDSTCVHCSHSQAQTLQPMAYAPQDYTPMFMTMTTAGLIILGGIVIVYLLTRKK